MIGGTHDRRYLVNRELLVVSGLNPRSDQDSDRDLDQDSDRDLDQDSDGDLDQDSDRDSDPVGRLKIWTKFGMDDFLHPESNIGDWRWILRSNQGQSFTHSLCKSKPGCAQINPQV